LNRLVDLSTRGMISDSDALTAGVVVGGTAATKLLVRAVGPGLTTFGVNGNVARPRLTVYSNGISIGTNAGWESAPQSAQMAAAANATGAFSLATGSADSALLLTVAPGSYTAEVTGIGSSGVALVEIYEVP
jgi:hypothetical protein